MSFEEFAAVVKAGLHYDDFFRRASALFATCDPHGTGHVPRSMLQLALRQVHTDVDVSGIANALRHERGKEGGAQPEAGTSPAGSSSFIESCAGPCLDSNTHTLSTWRSTQLPPGGTRLTTSDTVSHVTSTPATRVEVWLRGEEV